MGEDFGPEMTIHGLGYRGLNTALDWPDWSAEDLRPAVEVALECFGPERLMCGSDWPYSLLNGEFDRVWGLTSRAIVDAAPDHAEQLLGGNASRIYRRARRVGRS